MPADPPTTPKDVADILEALARRIRHDASLPRAPRAPPQAPGGMTVTPPQKVEPFDEEEEPDLGEVDVFADEQQVTVTLETRNVDPAAVSVSLVNGHLFIGVGEGDKACRRDLALPAPVDEEKAFATFRNGVLDVVLPRKQG